MTRSLVRLNKTWIGYTTICHNVCKLLQPSNCSWTATAFVISFHNVKYGQCVMSCWLVGWLVGYNSCMLYVTIALHRLMWIRRSWIQRQKYFMQMWHTLRNKQHSGWNWLKISIRHWRSVCCRCCLWWVCALGASTHIYYMINYGRKSFFRPFLVRNWRCGKLVSKHCDDMQTISSALEYAYKGNSSWKYPR